MQIAELLNTHILIGGCSGSGKSVLIHHIINSLNGNGLVLIDLKMVELKEYKSRACAYADSPREVIHALESVRNCIHKRLRAMDRKHLKCWDGGLLVVVIDEFMDCYIKCGKQFMNIVTDIACIGRAAGVRLVIATQRPTRRYLDAISSNLDTRIALRCSTASDSRLIVGVKGAEDLPFHGQAMVKLPSRKDIVTINIPNI